MVRLFIYISSQIQISLLIIKLFRPYHSVHSSFNVIYGNSQSTTNKVNYGTCCTVNKSIFFPISCNFLRKKSWCRFLRNGMADCDKFYLKTLHDHQLFFSSATLYPMKQFAPALLKKPPV